MPFSDGMRKLVSTSKYFAWYTYFFKDFFTPGQFDLLTYKMIGHIGPTLTPLGSLKKVVKAFCCIFYLYMNEQTIRTYGAYCTMYNFLYMQYITPLRNCEKCKLLSKHFWPPMYNVQRWHACNLLIEKVTLCSE